MSGSLCPIAIPLSSTAVFTAPPMVMLERRTLAPFEAFEVFDAVRSLRKLLARLSSPGLESWLDVREMWSAEIERCSMDLEVEAVCGGKRVAVT
jgi:hypothetical protein